MIRKVWEGVKKRGFYVGIDMDDQNAVVSYYDDGMKEPGTVSLVAGSEVFQIPVLIAKKKGMGQWFIGQEAERIDRLELGTAIDRLLERALAKEEIVMEGEVYEARELLILFLRKLIGYAGGISQSSEPEACAISVNELNKEYAKLLSVVGEQLGYDKEDWMILDRKSAFYYFALNQQSDLWLHDVSLFDFRGQELQCMLLKRNQNTVPQLVTISEEKFRLQEEAKDEEFYQVLVNAFAGKVISSVYLVGEAFEGDWMKLSLAYMCRGRRAFMGKNLYAKGNCYAIMALKGEEAWPYVYMGDNEVKVNVSLKVLNRGVEEFYTLLNAGENWYEAMGECEVILAEDKDISIWLQLPNSKEAKVETLTLTDLPDRESKTTRLRITAKPMSDTQIQIRIKDLGFGEIVKSSNLNWEYRMSI